MQLYTLILDRSGSMSSCWSEITQAVNQHLLEKSKDALCSVLLFDTEGIEFLFKNAQNPGELNTDNFKPRGGTPLRDAIMFGVEELVRDWGNFLFQEFVDVEFTVFSDGEENSSKLWQSPDVARTLTHFQESYNWKFSFIGAGDQTDVANYAKQFGIREENVVGYSGKEELAAVFTKV